MIRRFPLAAAGVAAVLIIASGCDSVSQNKNAAEANDHELSIDTFSKAAGELGKDQVVDGEIPGAYARTVLTSWVKSALLTDVLADQGLVVDDAARATTEETLKSQNTDNWNALSPESQQFLIDIQAPLELISNSDSFVPADTIQSTYEAGATSSGLFCLRVIVAPDQATAADIQSQLGAGADFATLADQYPIDPSAPAGGVFLDPETSTECTSINTLAQEYASLIAQAPIGQPTDPIELSGSYVFFLQRPFAEVSDELHTKLGPALAGPIIDGLVKGKSARIDSRYGTWDADTSTVVEAS